MPTPAEQFETAATAYYDNVPPFTSAGQCAAFISACARLIALTPTMSGNREGSMQFDVKLLREEKVDAQAWYDANGGSGSDTSANGSPSSAIVRASLRNFRC